MNETSEPQPARRERAPSRGAAAADVPAGDMAPLIAAPRFKASAVIIAERIDVKVLGHLPVVAHFPPMTRLPGGGVAALFRYGAMVFFAEETGDRDWLIAAVRSAMSGGGDPATEESVRVEIGGQLAEGPSGDVVQMRDASAARLQLLAEALAKAALLTFYEHRAAADFDRVEPLARDLAEDGRFSVGSRELLQAVGSMRLAEQRLTGRAEVMDKPDLLWDNPALEGLYARLEGDFELRERGLALERKLAALSNTAETLVEIVRHKSSLRVEWYIVFLIVFEIVLTLHEKFFR